MIDDIEQQEGDQPFIFDEVVEEDVVADIFNAIDEERVARQKIIDYCRMAVPKLVEETGFDDFEVIQDCDQTGFILQVSQPTVINKKTRDARYRLVVAGSFSVKFFLKDYDGDYYNNHNHYILKALYRKMNGEVDYEGRKVNTDVTNIGTRNKEGVNHLISLEVPLKDGLTFVKQVLAFSVACAGLAPKLNEEMYPERDRPARLKQGKVTL